MSSNEIKVSGSFWEEFQSLCSYSDPAYLEEKILHKNTDELVSNPIMPWISSVISDKLGKC